MMVSRELYERIDEVKAELHQILHGYSKRKEDHIAVDRLCMRMVILVSEFGDPPLRELAQEIMDAISDPLLDGLHD